jgi:hypothetical protein
LDSGIRGSPAACLLRISAAVFSKARKRSGLAVSGLN